MTTQEEAKKALAWRLLASVGVSTFDRARMMSYIRQNLATVARVGAEMEAAYAKNTQALKAQDDRRLAGLPAALRAASARMALPAMNSVTEAAVATGHVAAAWSAIADDSALYRIVRSYMPDAQVNTVTASLDAGTRESGGIPTPSELSILPTDPAVYNALAYGLLIAAGLALLSLARARRRNRQR